MRVPARAGQTIFCIRPLSDHCINISEVYYFGIIDHCCISVILRQRRHQIDRYMSPRLVVTKSKRKKYSSYPDIEYAAAKRTKQNSNNSNQENHPNEEEVGKVFYVC